MKTTMRISRNDHAERYRERGPVGGKHVAGEDGDASAGDDAAASETVAFAAVWSTKCSVANAD